MGYFRALDLQDTELGLGIEQQINIHLSSNIYPPVPDLMVQPCIDAIILANQELWYDHVAMPDMVEWDGKPYAPADEIIDAFRLEAWITNND